jgi:hypothetical protein
MGASKDILDDLKNQLRSKREQREVILDQLQLIDVLIDKYDVIISNVDKDALKFTDPINKSANEVKAAYDARISAGCRSNLKWVEISRSRVFVPSGGGGGGFTDTVLYEVQENLETAAFKPYDGIKYYQKPSNRDYGSLLVGKFNGNVIQNSNVVAVAITDQSTVNPLLGIVIGDTITDNLDNPTIFNIGELPEVTGFGTTDSIGIVTTLTGGIFTGGVTFFNFGAGSLEDVETGMLLLDTGAFSGSGNYEPTLQDGTTIVGFGTGEFPVEFINDIGELEISLVPCNTVTIDKPALRDLEEGEFVVGIVTNFPAIFLSTVSNLNETNAEFLAIRTANRDNIDADFDITLNPNSPLKIGSIGPGNLGVGSSAYYDFSGRPSATQEWRPEDDRDEIRTGKNNKKLLVPEVREPEIGAGQAPYNTGTLQWPTTSIFGGFGYGGFGGIGTGINYAPLGKKLRTSIGAFSISYASSPPGGFPGNCGALDAAISQAESNYSEIVPKNRPEAQKLVAQTAILRTERDKKEKMAWSLLQASSSLRKDIADLRVAISELEGVDFSSYER